MTLFAECEYMHEMLCNRTQAYALILSGCACTLRLLLKDIVVLTGQDEALTVPRQSMISTTRIIPGSLSVAKGALTWQLQEMHQAKTIVLFSQKLLQ